MRDGLQEVLGWCRELAPGEPVGLNVVLTDGERMVASRWGRSLWFLERDAVERCGQCGRPHVHHEPGVPYRAVEVASEPVTPGDPWCPLPEACVLGLEAGRAVRIEPLSGHRLPVPEPRRAAG